MPHATPSPTAAQGLRREAVEANRDDCARRARLYEQRGPSPGDRDMGMTAADARDLARFYRSEQRRLDEVLAYMDAGEAVPTRLLPEAS